MSELERRRGARDVWISRSHVSAAAVGAAVLSGISFIVGMSLGAAAGGSVGQGARAQNGASDRLVDLLARVETAADLEGGVDQLTFPDELPGRNVGPGSPIPDGAGGPEPRFLLESAAVATAWADAPPAEDVASHRVLSTGAADEARALRDALRSEGLDARAYPKELLEGRMRWHVAVVFDSTQALQAYLRDQAR